ncbi:hypothetical protein B0H14DRAFT_3485136 [Mycena olivaceomarginata]|nr:hypothetical protein B0H14DRAFT_3485136 [Mycena olivaceomarginata]
MSGRVLRGRPRARDLLDLDAEEPGADEQLVADRGIYVAADGLSRQEELLNVGMKKKRVLPSELQDPLGEWLPVPEYGDDEGNEATSSEPAALGKRKEYASTRDTASLWRPLKAMFLDEVSLHTNDLMRRAYKCYDCGQYLQCGDCCLLHHQRTPLHVLQEWNGSFWKTCTLESIGLVYQLGHGGFPCPSPDDAVRTLVVIEAPMIHQIRTTWNSLLRNGWYPATVTDPKTVATFRSLESYRLYAVLGNMNVKDFVTAMERMTDATSVSGMTWLLDRYKQFQWMARQWAFLKRIKRAGRGHDPAGVDKTKLGECTVMCWACPHDGRNLPENWREVAPAYRFLYMLIVAMDANFRLRNRMRANEIDDPSLGPGWGCWVDSTAYRDHIKNYVPESDVSTCIAFAALLQKDTRMTTGLRVSGVGGVVYCNMDFIVMAALAGLGLLMLTISYDIACQWKVNLAERVKKLPRHMQLPMDDIKLQCALPVWHASSHNGDCKEANSLSFKEGVGKSDGEGVERTWAVLNPAAYATKDAGIGQRADALEDRLDNHNYLKNIGQGDALRRKLVVAITERDRQIQVFESVSATIERTVKIKWKTMIRDWIDDPSQPNPYVLASKACPSEAEVRAELRREEAALGAAGTAPLHGGSATAFLAAGIQIEDAQRRIVSELTGTVLVAADRENKIQEWRHTLLTKIARFRTLQRIYMPGAMDAIAAAEEERENDDPAPKPEHIKLWMPNEMAATGPDDLLRGCVPGMVDMEARLRVAQCENSLVGLRSRLHAKRFLIDHRNANVTGQVASTKARTLIGQVGERVDAQAKRRFDFGWDGEDTDAAARKKLAMIGAGRGARTPRNVAGTSKRVMSWIWTAPGAFDDEEQHLHDSIRVEWCRARARKVRWSEEVMLLREEMRRVVRYLGWQTAWWRDRAELRMGLTREIAAGVRAYALKQADWHERLAGFLRVKWDVSAAVAAQGEQVPEGLDMLYE